MDNYRIVKNTTVWGLQFEVNELVNEGWEPQGTLVVKDGEYIQSMIKKAEPVLVEEAPADEIINEVVEEPVVELEEEIPVLED